MKSNKGVTLIALTIIIIVMLILLTTMTYNGLQEIQDAQKKNFVTNLKMIREKVDLYADKGSEVYSNIGKTITDPDSKLSSEELERMKKVARLSDITRYKYMDSEEYKKMGLEGIEDITLINFETREVISIKGVNIDNQSYYTLAEINSEKYMPVSSNGYKDQMVEETPAEITQSGDKVLQITNIKNMLIVRPKFKNDSMNYNYYEYYWKKLSGSKPDTQYHKSKIQEPECMIELEYGETYEISVSAYSSNGSYVKSNIAIVVIR